MFNLNISRSSLHWSLLALASDAKGAEAGGAAQGWGQLWLAWICHRWTQGRNLVLYLHRPRSFLHNVTLKHCLNLLISLLQKVTELYLSLDGYFLMHKVEIMVTALFNTHEKEPCPSLAYIRNILLAQKFYFSSKVGGWVIFAFLFVPMIIFPWFCSFFHHWPQHAHCFLQVSLQMRQLLWFGHRVDSISLATGAAQRLPAWYFYFFPHFSSHHSHGKGHCRIR